MEERELSSPSPRKILDSGHTIHTSLEPSSPLASKPAHPMLTDFGEARYVDKERQLELIQADEYRAPEVIFGTGWSFPADVWNFGNMVSHEYRQRQ